VNHPQRASSIGEHQAMGAISIPQTAYHIIPYENQKLLILLVGIMARKGIYL
jgi:hypothetical protein